MSIYIYIYVCHLLDSTNFQKINFHLRLNNSIFYECDHPIWGAIMSVNPQVPIQDGQEVLMYYGYRPAEFPSDFPWYWETKLLLEREERLKKEAKIGCFMDFNP